MRKERLTAFSDGVFAIIITIMVLELKAPHDSAPSALASLAPTFASYVLSFIYVAIYWNNHHHLLGTVRRIDGSCLWANMALLFFLSLVPFSTAWLGETHFATWPAALYGVTLLFPGICYAILQRVLARHPENARLAAAIGRDLKGNLSLIIYVAGIALAFVDARLSLVLFALVAVMWLVPDRRLERLVDADAGTGQD